MADKVLLQEGFAHLEVADFITTDRNGGPRTSSTGYPMAELKIHATDRSGRYTTIYDYVLPTHPKMSWKIAQIKRCFDVGDFYVGGQWLPHILMHKTGMGTVKTQEASGEYSEKTVIGSYMDKDAVNFLLNAASPEIQPIKSESRVQVASVPVAKSYESKDGDPDLDDVPF